MRTVYAAAAALVAILLSSSLLRKEDLRASPEEYALVHETLDQSHQAIERLAKVLTVPTLADAEAPNSVPGDGDPFQRLSALLPEAFPEAFGALKVERINTYSLLMTWEGTDPSLRPLVLLSHQDVVPTPGADTWTHPPFSGVVDDEFVWGRGALDTKSSLTAILDAVCHLLRAGFTPTRTVLLAFGHDEEVGGEAGARALAATLAARGIEPELVLDEGGLVLEDGLRAKGTLVVPGPLAVVGTAEKGWQNWEIKVDGVAGHSSVPPTGQGISVAARLARVLSRLDAQQMSSRLAAPTTDFLQGLAAGVRWAPVRALLRLADHPLVNPGLGQALGSGDSKELAAMVRSTVAVVAVQAGGAADNVLPASGTIRLNLRTLPGDNVAAVQQYLNVVLQKEGGHATAALRPGGVTPASPVTPAAGAAWDLVVRAIQESLPCGANSTRSLPVVPYLVTGMTDSRHYAEIAPGRVFRFSPIRVTMRDLDRVHGVDERIGKGAYLDGIRFYMRFIKLAAGNGVMENGG